MDERCKVCTSLEVLNPWNVLTRGFLVVTNVGSDDGVGGQGNTIIATVEDTCPGCDQNHIDFSVGSWNQLTNNAAFGTANIEW